MVVLMGLPFSGSVDASFDSLGSALVSTGAVFLLLGFAFVSALVLSCNSSPGIFEWPLTFAYIPSALGLCLMCIGGILWHRRELREQDLMEYVMSENEKEQAATVEIDGEIVSLEADIGIEQNDS